VGSPAVNLAEYLWPQPQGWNPAYPVLRKISSAYFFNDGIRPYKNLPWLNQTYSASVGNAGMTNLTNRLGPFIRKTTGGFTYLFSGAIAQGSTSYALLGCHTNATNVELFGDGSKDWKISSGGFLEAYFSSGSRGVGSTSLVTGVPIVVSVDSIDSASKGYVNGALEVSFSGWGSAGSVSRIGSTNNSGTSNWGVGAQVFLGFSSVLTAAEHKIISDILLRDPMELFAQPQPILWGGASAPAAALAGAASDVASASGTLSSGIRLAGGPAAVAGATGSLTSGIPLAGQAAAVSVANGVLNTSVRLSGDALAQVIASGILTSGIPLAGNLISVALSNGGVLTTQIPLSGAAVAQAAATASLTTGTGYTLQDIADAVWAKVLP
jgi:hypothetical protein